MSTSEGSVQRSRKTGRELFGNLPGSYLIVKTDCMSVLSCIFR